MEDALAADDVGRRDEDLAVEAAGPEQRRVELLEQVRGGDHDHVLARGEAVHLDQQLVQSLVPLARDVVAAVAADGVELVDEHDRRRLLARGLEQVADAGGADADEHLDERGRGLREERRAGLVRDRLRKQRLAGPGRAVEQDSLGHLRAEIAEALGVAQIVDDLAELLLGLFGAGDVGPRDRRRRVGLDLLRARARHEPHQREHGHDQQAHEDDRQPRLEERAHVRVAHERAGGVEDRHEEVDVRWSVGLGYVGGSVGNAGNLDHGAITLIGTRSGSLNPLQARIRRIASSHLRARPSIHVHDIGGEVVIAADQR